MTSVTHSNIYDRVKEKIFATRKEISTKIAAKINNSDLDHIEVNTDHWARKVSQCRTHQILQYVNSSRFTNQVLFDILVSFEYIGNASKVKNYKNIINDIFQMAFIMELHNGCDKQAFAKLTRIDDLQNNYLIADGDWNIMKRLFQTNIVCDDIITAGLVAVGIVNKLDTVTVSIRDSEKCENFGFDRQDESKQGEIFLLPSIAIRRKKIPYNRQKREYKTGYNPRSHALEGDKDDNIFFEPSISIKPIPTVTTHNGSSVLQAGNHSSSVDPINIEESLNQNGMIPIDDSQIDDISELSDHTQSNERVLCALRICEKAEIILQQLYEDEESRKESLFEVVKMILDDDYFIADTLDLEYLLDIENKLDVNQFAKGAKEQWDREGLEVDEYDVEELRDQTSTYYGKLLFEQQDKIDILMFKKSHCELRLLKPEFDTLQELHENVHGQTAYSWHPNFVALYSLYHSTAQYVSEGQIASPTITRIIHSYKLLSTDLSEMLCSKEDIIPLQTEIQADLLCAICSSPLSTETMYIGETMKCYNCMEDVHLECHMHQTQLKSLEITDLTFCIKCQNNAVSSQPLLFCLPVPLTSTQ